VIEDFLGNSDSGRRRHASTSIRIRPIGWQHRTSVAHNVLRRGYGYSIFSITSRRPLKSSPMEYIE